MLVPHVVVLALLKAENELAEFHVPRHDEGSIGHCFDELPGRLWQVLRSILDT